MALRHLNEGQQAILKGVATLGAKIEDKETHSREEFIKTRDEIKQLRGELIPLIAKVETAGRPMPEESSQIKELKEMFDRNKELELRVQNAEREYEKLKQEETKTGALFA